MPPVPTPLCPDLSAASGGLLRWLGARMAGAAGWSGVTVLRRWLRLGGVEDAKLVAVCSLENESERGGIGTAPALSAAWVYVVDAILDAMVYDDALPGNDDVAIPVDVVAIGELGDESLGSFGEDHRRFVGTASLASNMTDERERPAPGSSYPARRPIQGVVQ